MKVGRWGWERPPNYPTTSLLKYWWIRTCHCFFACTNWVCCEHSSSIPRVKTNNKSYLRAEAKITWRTGFVASNDRGDRFDSAIFASRQRMELGVLWTWPISDSQKDRQTDRQPRREGQPVQSSGHGYWFVSIFWASFRMMIIDQRDGFTHNSSGLIAV